jgi:alpha-aminoadipate carrier protein LysW
MISRCPLCGGNVKVPDDALPGEIIEHSCGATLEVHSNNGSIILKLADIEEDWGE